jgi:hypothetical protein
MEKSGVIWTVMGVVLISLLAGRRGEGEGGPSPCQQIHLYN